jgi:alpha-2-macroglobulin
MTDGENTSSLVDNSSIDNGHKATKLKSPQLKIQFYKIAKISFGFATLISGVIFILFGIVLTFFLDSNPTQPVNAIFGNTIMNLVGIILLTSGLPLIISGSYLLKSLVKVLLSKFNLKLVTNKNNIIIHQNLSANTYRVNSFFKIVIKTYTYYLMLMGIFWLFMAYVGITNSFIFDILDKNPLVLDDINFILYCTFFSSIYLYSGYLFGTYLNKIKLHILANINNNTSTSPVIQTGIFTLGFVRFFKKLNGVFLLLYGLIFMVHSITYAIDFVMGAFSVKYDLFRIVEDLFKLVYKSASSAVLLIVGIITFNNSKKFPGKIYIKYLITFKLLIISIKFWVLSYNAFHSFMLQKAFKNYSYEGLQISLFRMLLAILPLLIIIKFKDKLEVKTMISRLRQLFIFNKLIILLGSIMAGIRGFLKWPFKKKAQVLISFIISIVIISGIYLALKTVQPLLECPSIVRAYPTDQSNEVPLDTTIELAFSKPMNKKTVELSIEKSIDRKGNFEWVNDHNVIFTPETRLERDVAYLLDLKNSKSKYGFKIKSETLISFTTVANPKISVFSPTTVAVDDSTPITILFDRPMIPLTTVDNKEKFASPITITPDIEGEGRWIGTTAYQFIPKTRYKLGTTYKVNVLGGINSTDGGIMRNDFSWEFSSPAPYVIKTYPSYKDQYADPNGEIRITFNQPVDMLSLNEYISLRESGTYLNENIPIGKVYKIERDPNEIINYWEEQESPTNFTVGFKPLRTLSKGRFYSLVVKEGVKDAEGDNRMETKFESGFATITDPELIGTSPYDAQQEVVEQYGVDLRFKTPMNDKSFTGNVSITPKPSGGLTFYANNYNGANTIRINTSLRRSTKYLITVNPNVMDIYGTPLGRSYTFSFTTAQYKPNITVQPNIDFGTFNQLETPRIVAKVMNTNVVNYELYQLSKADFMELYKIKYESNYPSCRGLSTYIEQDDCRNWQLLDKAKYKFVKNWKESFTPDLNVSTNVITKVTATNGEKLNAGLYYLELNSPDVDKKDGLVMVVSNNTMAVKTSSDQLFTWVVNQNSSDAIKDINMFAYYNNGTVAATGKTNSDGVWSADVKSSYDRPIRFVFGEKNGDIVVNIDNWDMGINKYDFGVGNYYGYDDSEYKVHFVLDRPIYRPGQKFYFKGIIRKQKGNTLENIQDGTKLKIEYSTPNGLVESKDIYVNKYGSFSSDFMIPESAPLGSHTISFTYNNQSFQEEFSVEEYQKSDLDLQISSLDNSYTAGSNIGAKISATYLFGAPITNTKVTWYSMIQDYYFNWDGDNNYSFSDNENNWYYWGPRYYNSESSQYGSVVTDNEGIAQIMVPTQSYIGKGSKLLVIDAGMTDVNNKYASTRKEMVIHQGEYYMGIKPESYSGEKDKESSVSVVAVDHQGNTLRNIEAKVEFYKEEWYTVKEKDPGSGQYFYTSKTRNTLVETVKIKTDDRGYAKAAFIPNSGGSYKALVRSKDTGGRSITASSYIWIAGEGYTAPRLNHDRINLTTDKRSYKVGEKAELFITTPYSLKTKTLITYENKKVMDYKIIDIDQLNNKYNFNIENKLVPNVFVSAFVFKNYENLKSPSEFKMGYAEINVEDPKNKIYVTVETDKKKYHPRDKASITIKAKDGNGNPVKGEFSIGIADKAVWNMSMVSYDKIYDLYYKKLSLNVSTSTPLTVSVDRVNANVNLGAKGGSGGGGGGESLSTSRFDFPDTLFWNGHVETNNEGYANVDVTLPDSLTTWKVDVIGSSAGNSFGSGKTEFITYKDILVRPMLPRFFAVNDTVYVGGLFLNGTDGSVNSQLSIEGTNVNILDDKNVSKVLTRNQQLKHLWKINIPNADNAGVKISVNTDSGFNDSVYIELPIKNRYTPQVTSNSGSIESVIEEKIVLPGSIDKSLGELKLSMSPVLGAENITGFKYNYDYPYECSEQSSSRIISTLAVFNILNAANLDEIEGVNRSSMDKIIRAVIQKLVNEQRADGGWGWWYSSGGSNPYTSAYVVEALLKAQKSGFPVPEKTIENGLSLISRNLQVKGLSENMQSYMVYVLSGSDQNDYLNSYINNLYTSRNLLSTESKAYLYLSIYNLEGKSSKAERIKDEILSSIKLEASTAYFKEVSGNYTYSMSSDIETTAKVLEMLNKTDIKNPIVPKIVNYITISRRSEEGYWVSTKSTASVISSISGYLLNSSIKDLDQSYKAEIGNLKFAEGTFTKNDLLKFSEHSIPINGLNSENSLKMYKSGTGNVYYTSSLKYYLPSSEVKETDQGFALVRDIFDVNGNKITDGKFKEGEEYVIKITVVTSKNRNFVVVEDQLPAGFESLNESLANQTSLSAKIAAVKTYEESGNNYGYHYSDQYDYYNSYAFSHKEYRDDRTAIFAENLYDGLYEISYRVRTTLPGTFVYPPTQAYEMYTPDVFGHTSGDMIEIIKK